MGGRVRCLQELESGWESKVSSKNLIYILSPLYLFLFSPLTLTLSLFLSPLSFSHFSLNLFSPLLDVFVLVYTKFIKLCYLNNIKIITFQLYIISVYFKMILNFFPTLLSSILVEFYLLFLPFLFQRVEFFLSIFLWAWIGK